MFLNKIMNEGQYFGYDLFTDKENKRLSTIICRENSLCAVI